MPTLNDVPAKPLIFCTRSIRAWQRGAKTQTRRLVRPQPPPGYGYEIVQTAKGLWIAEARNVLGAFHVTLSMRQPYAVGDLLWIRESLRRLGNGIVGYEVDEHVLIGLNDGVFVWNWKRNKLPAMFMPRWACRYYARVVSVRPQRLQEMLHHDAVMEGTLVGLDLPFGAASFRDLYLEWWDSLHKKLGTRSEDNPTVWVYRLEEAGDRSE